MYFKYKNICNRVLCSVIKCKRKYTCSSKTIVLGIETSCDDTGCAVVDNEANVLGESLYSQNAVHTKFGGVNPVNAWELHRDNIALATNEALKSANLNIYEINAIAVTVKPGLFLSLSVGVKYANFLARKYNKPLIPIHHMEAHALVARIYYDIPFPYLTLLMSGGHCILAVVNDVNNFLLLGQSLDNAPGEVMDKVARRMKLRNICEYAIVPGGKAIELASKKATNSSMFSFPVPLQKHRDCNFSFSGLKDSLLRKLERKEIEHGLMGDELIPEVNNLCAAFQTSVSKHLAHRLERAIKYCELKNFLKEKKNIVVSGGVACNDYIFTNLKFVSNQLGYNLYRPPHKVCTDNGVMIAWNGVEKIKKDIDIMEQISLSTINPSASLGEDITKNVKETNIPVRTPIL